MVNEKKVKGMDWLLLLTIPVVAAVVLLIKHLRKGADRFQNKKPSEISAQLSVRARARKTASELRGENREGQRQAGFRLERVAGQTLQ
jgi:hypothetical protein